MDDPPQHNENHPGRRNPPRDARAPPPLSSTPRKRVPRPSSSASRNARVSHSSSSTPLPSLPAPPTSDPPLPSLPAPPTSDPPLFSLPAPPTSPPPSAVEVSSAAEVSPAAVPPAAEVSPGVSAQPPHAANVATLRRSMRRIVKHLGVMSNQLKVLPILDHNVAYQTLEQNLEVKMKNIFQQLELKMDRRFNSMDRRFNSFEYNATVRTYNSMLRGGGPLMWPYNYKGERPINPPQTSFALGRSSEAQLDMLLGFYNLIPPSEDVLTKALTIGTYIGFETKN